MKRYCMYNGMVALGFLLFWAGLVVTEVKVEPLPFLKWI